MSFSYYTNPYWNGGGIGLPAAVRFGGGGSDLVERAQDRKTREIVKRIYEKAKRVEVGLIPPEQAIADPELALLLQEAYKAIASPKVQRILLQEDDEEAMLLVLASQILE